MKKTIMGGKNIYRFLLLCLVCVFCLMMAPEAKSFTGTINVNTQEYTGTGIINDPARGISIQDGANILIYGDFCGDHCQVGEHKITVAENANADITLRNVNSVGAFRVGTGARVNLIVEAENKLMGDGGAGIEVSGGSVLAISGSGCLTAIGAAQSAGIGSSRAQGIIAVCIIIHRVCGHKTCDLRDNIRQ